MSSVQSFQVTANRQIARDTYFLELDGDTSDITMPGQFVNLEVPGFYLRRPLSVCDWSPGHLTLMYKVLGEGTEALTHVDVGTEMSVLSGLGNGFWLPEGASNPLLVGGGIGVAPMLGLAKYLVSQGVWPTVVLGFGNASEVALVDEIRATGVPVVVSTVDGSHGVKGFVTDAMSQLASEEGWDYVYACGPTPMLRAVFATAGKPGQYSMEERMACGFGGCMGCTLPTAEGMVRICKEGPVFESQVLPW